MSANLRWETPGDGPRRVPLYREPVRMALLGGATLALIGSVLPWAEGHLPSGAAVSFSPIGNADGVLIVIVVATAAGLALSRSVAESRTRTLQVALAILGVAAVVIWLGSIGGERRLVVNGVRPAWGSTSGIGIVVAAVGVAMLFVSGTILSVRAWRSNGILADPSERAVTGRSVVRGVIEVGGGLVGFVAGIAAVLILAGPYALAPMAFAAFFGAAIGMALGNRVASRV